MGGNALRTKSQTVTTTAAYLDFSNIPISEDVVDVAVRVVSGTPLLQGQPGDDFVTIGTGLSFEVNFNERLQSTHPKVKTSTGTAEIAIVVGVDKKN